MSIRRFTVREALRWIGCGWRIWKRNLLFWWAVATTYILIAFALTRVPWLGSTILLMLSPIIAAGVLSTVSQQLSPPKNRPRSVRYLLKRARSGPEKLLVLARPLVRALFGSFTDEKRIMPLMGIGLGTALIGGLVELLGLNMTGAFYRASETVTDLGFFQGLRLAFAYLIMFTTYLVLTTVYVYLISLYVIDDRPLFAAAQASFKACIPNAIPCLVYVGTLVLPVLLAGLLIDVYLMSGLALLLVVGSVALPLLITSAYCTSRLMYR